jgi:predicted DNA-binding protein (UPF0251 family)
MSMGQMTERGLVIPSWTPRHKSLDMAVFHEDKPMGFSVGDMLPERRWAVDANGNTLERREFKESFQKFWMMHTKNEVADLVPIPNIKEFISQTVGPEGKMVPIGWSLEDERPVEIKDRRDYPSLSPDQAAARDTMTTDAAKIALIKGMVKKGTLTAAQGMEEIMQLSEYSPSVAGEASSNTNIDIDEETSTAPEGDIEETASLTPSESKAVELLAGRDMTKGVIEEIAKEMGIKEGSARAYLYTAKKKVSEAA